LCTDYIDQACSGFPGSHLHSHQNYTWSKKEMRIPQIIINTHTFLGLWIKRSRRVPH
jgi:hypothetical protein